MSEATFLPLDELDGATRYKLLAAAIVPRPIGWVSTRSAQGVDNLAPYSFFNMMGGSPPLLVLGTLRQDDGRLKDSAANLLETKECVIHLVSESMLEAMNATCIDAPPDVSEAQWARIAMTNSRMVAPQRIAQAPVAIECRLFQHIDAPPSTLILVVEAVGLHMAEAFFDAERMRVDPLAMQLVGRVHGPGAYTRIAVDRVLERPVWGGDEPR